MGTGTSLVIAVPSNNWPCTLFPQHSAVPVLVSAQVWVHPEVKFTLTLDQLGLGEGARDGLAVSDVDADAVVVDDTDGLADGPSHGNTTRD